MRREAAALLSTIARHFAAPHHNLQPRLCRVLAQALLDADKPLTSKYGAVVGLQVRACNLTHCSQYQACHVFIGGSNPAARAYGG